MKRVLVFCLVIASVLGLMSCTKPNGPSAPLTSVEDYSFTVTDTPTDHVLITMNNGSGILIELYPEVAPITVQNFKNLVARHFYDGIIFHRVIPGFMIQGGDPNGDGIGGSEQTIKGEFAANGVKNDLKHTRGVISMARTSNSYNSASSQFFIMHQDSSHLDGQYAAFGRVIAGMDTVDAIAATETNSKDRPLTEQRMESVRFVDLSQTTSGVVTTEPAETVVTEPVTELDGYILKESQEPTNYVRIQMTDGSAMLVRLAPEVAPITVQNFKDLVARQFYDGITFHRVIENFMIQGGDPDGDGIGGSEQTIKGEFAVNGVPNDLKHTRGVISMARTAYDYNSASSQFFIVHRDSEHLDGQYAAFGYLLAGFDTLDAIAATATDGQDRPLKAKTMYSVRFVTVTEPSMTT